MTDDSQQQETIRMQVKQKDEKPKHPKSKKRLKLKSTTIAEKMSTKLCTTMPTKLAEIGCTVQMEEVFREGPYVVIQIQVQRVDARAICRLQTEGGEQHAITDKRTNAGTVHTGGAAATQQQNRKKQ